MALSVRDGISPRVARMSAEVSDKRPMLEVMGVTLQSWAIRSFSDPAMRVRPWAVKKDGTPSTLEKTTMLRQSLGRQPAVTQSTVTVGSDRAYAAVHQFGSRSKTGRGGGIPARPYLPFAPDGKMMLSAHLEIEQAAADQLRRQLGLKR